MATAIAIAIVERDTHLLYLLAQLRQSKYTRFMCENEQISRNKKRISHLQCFTVNGVGKKICNKEKNTCETLKSIDRKSTAAK